MHNALTELPRTMTVAEFLDWPGDGSGRKFQLVDGELRAMSPGSATHGTMQMTLGRLIGTALIDAGGRCRVVGEPGVITQIRSDMNMRVPDLGVSCTADAPGQRALPDPILLIEILSPSNASDTWDNVWAYTTIPSVDEVVVVHSMRVLAEVLRRGADGRWPKETEKIGPEGTLRLDSIDFACALREAYTQTHLV
ncbi:MAG TPA: Uma2 family endonuclease [Hyphomicrobiaceae bacterium]|jgi:Uma2 family endonuclease|nr:Uma2 family endonuclease [Hyphomicrobiaceae bacterium]